VAGFYRWPVRMAEHHRRKAGRQRIEIEFGDVVKHVEHMCADLDDIGGWQARRPSSFVDIPADRERWDDEGKPIDDFGIADMARVDDEIAPLECAAGLRWEQPVRSGNHAEAEIDFALACGGAISRLWMRRLRPRLDLPVVRKATEPLLGEL